jgi:hypothetical protein
LKKPHPPGERGVKKVETNCCSASTCYVIYSWLRNIYGG